MLIPVLILATLIRAHEYVALAFHFDALEGDWRSYCFVYGHKKFQRLANSWKNRTLRNFRVGSLPSYIVLLYFYSTGVVVVATPDYLQVGRMLNLVDQDRHSR